MNEGSGQTELTPEGPGAGKELREEDYGWGKFWPNPRRTEVSPVKRNCTAKSSIP